MTLPLKCREQREPVPPNALQIRFSNRPVLFRVCSSRNPELWTGLAANAIFLLMTERKSGQGKWTSYTMVEERMKKIYFKFYQETYKTSRLDRKTKELIAIAASLGFRAKGV